ncbi:unnamed protein product [Prorocentrum cordatum]|uniref:Cellulase n=1 Tax=Prorocentrum cordatum TaxID=2364126 RepID=A0ABN9PVN3_9DINO|nr:unnamed protein product [Polarella glacialis]
MPLMAGWATLARVCDDRGQAQGAEMLEVAKPHLQDDGGRFCKGSHIGARNPYFSGCAVAVGQPFACAEASSEADSWPRPGSARGGAGREAAGEGAGATDGQKRRAAARRAARGGLDDGGESENACSDWRELCKGVDNRVARW